MYPATWPYQGQLSATPKSSSTSWRFSHQSGNLELCNTSLVYLQACSKYQLMCDIHIMKHILVISCALVFGLDI